MVHWPSCIPPPTLQLGTFPCPPEAENFRIHCSQPHHPGPHLSLKDWALQAHICAHTWKIASQGVAQTQRRQACREAASELRDPLTDPQGCHSTWQIAIWAVIFASSATAAPTARKNSMNPDGVNQYKWAALARLHVELDPGQHVVVAGIPVTPAQGLLLAGT